MLDILNNWCENNKINLNAEKSKVVHFRNPSVQRSSFNFSCGDHMLEITTQYNLPRPAFDRILKL